MADPAMPSGSSPLVLRLQAMGGNLTRSEALLAQWMARNEAILDLETGASIAAKTRVSEITVSRFLCPGGATHRRAGGAIREWLSPLPRTN